MWALMHRTGVMTRDALAETVRDFMSGSVGRDFWRQARGHRTLAERDRFDIRFNAILDEQYELSAGPDDPWPAA
ncbi:hypothetical protein BGM19_03505 [Streptomyces agglomeratus]|nr:hypothetical protein BGM19_03505 [Streptomyces agglomeratus]